VDDFKRLNDVYGHQVGDQSLIEVAHRLQARVRDDDLLARFGGDEFVLLTRTPPSALPELCSRLIASLRDPLHLQDVTVEATLSIGAACSRPGDDYESVLGRADEGLYEAKGSGGDTFVIAGS
jgi:diguanylate cyclase (GGDEF)-like protein